MKNFEYPVLLRPSTEGGFVVTCRDLPQLITQGDDKEEALAQAADAMDEVFATYMLQGLRFPTPSKRRTGEYMVSPPVETVTKALLHDAIQEANMSKVQLAKRLDIDEKEVRRLLDPHHGSKLPRLVQAMEALGQRLVVGAEPIRTIA